MKTTPLPGDAPNPEPAGSRFEKIEKIECLYRYVSNGVYYAFVKQNGNKKRISLKTTDVKAAKLKLGDLKRDMGKLDLSQSKITLRELCKRYTKTFQDLAPKTVGGKSTVLESLLKTFPLGADCQINKIKASDLQGWLAQKKFGYASHNHYVQTIRALFEIALMDKLLVESPAKDMKGKKVVKPRRVTPTYEEFNAIIGDVRKQKYNSEAEDSGDYLEFMGNIGVGQAEASGIMKQHVNLAKEQLTFFRVKTKKPYYVPIFPQAKALVQKLYDQTKVQTDLLFPVSNLKGKKGDGIRQITKDGKKALTAACARLGLPHYTQRSLRRMFITRCMEKGIEVNIIASWQGHSDGGKLILGTYAHVRNVRAEEMAKLLTA